MSKRAMSLQLQDSPSLGMKVGVAAGKQLRRPSVGSMSDRRGSMWPPGKSRILFIIMVFVWNKVEGGVQNTSPVTLTKGVPVK